MNSACSIRFLTACAVLLCACGGGGSGGEPGPTPPAPQHLSAQSGAQRVTLSWDAVEGATSYTVYWSQAAGVSKASGTAVTGLTATGYVHAHLLPGVNHYVVTATGPDGESKESEEVTGAVNLVAFASSATGQGNLSAWAGAGGLAGLAAADHICQSLADDAGLVGTFRAWMSDSGDDAYCRIHGLSGKKASNCGQATLPVAAGPWVRMDGEAFAGSIAAITAPSLLEDVRLPLHLDETGTRASPMNVYILSGTAPEGDVVRAELTCDDWSSAAHGAGYDAGAILYVGAAWAHSSSVYCDYAGHLGCLQMGTGPALPPPPAVAGARTAFVTSTQGTGDLSTWAGAGGNTGAAAGDAVCRALAAAAGLPNPTSYKAWLAAGGNGPSARISAAGPWVRTDGVELASSKDALDSAQLLTGLNVDEDGDIVSLYEFAWTGAWVSTPLPTCNDWKSGLSSVEGARGWYSSTVSDWQSAGVFGCNTSAHLYCFEDSP